MLRNALGSRAQGKWMMHYPEHLGALAQGLGGANDVAAARATIDETLARANRDGALGMLRSIFGSKVS